MVVRKAHLPSLAQLSSRSRARTARRLDVTREIGDFMRTRHKAYKSFTDTQVIAAMNNSEPRWYAVLPAAIDSVSLDTLIDTFSSVAFLVWTGEQLVKHHTLPRVEWLELPVDVDTEAAALQSSTMADEIIQKLF